MDSYETIKEIDGRLKLFEKKHSVLNVGCGDGGVPKYACENSATVFGIEVDKKFKQKLERLQRRETNFKLRWGNVFDILPSALTGGETVDTLLHLLPIGPIQSVKAMEAVIHLLKPDGKILFVSPLEGQEPSALKPFMSKLLEGMSLTVKGFVQHGDSLYAYAIKRKPEKTLDVIALT